MLRFTTLARPGRIRLIGLLIALGLVMVLLLLARAQHSWFSGGAQAQSSQIVACVNPFHGTTKIVYNASQCTATDRVVTWNIAGIQGPQGPQGVQGPEGERGPQGEQGLQGEQGMQGIQGETGPRGLQGLVGPGGSEVVTVSASISLPPGGGNSSDCVCPGAHRVIGGGVVVDLPGNSALLRDLTLAQSGPLDNTTWRLSIVNDSSETITGNVYALCLPN